ncbi:MAG: DUF4440 domain-containing protein [Candidatus Binatia bacterium]
MAESLEQTVDRMNRLFAENRWEEYFRGVSDQALGTVVSDSGAVRANKQEFRAFADHLEVTEFRVWDVQIKQVGDTGWVLLKHVQRQKIDGVPSSWTGDATDVYVREADGVWRLAAWHFNGFEEK